MASAILMAVRLPPSSSWISRAMRVRSCSLTFSMWAVSSASRAREWRTSSCSSLLSVMLVMMPSHCTAPPASARGVERRLIHLTSFQASTQMRPSQFQLHSAPAEAVIESR